MKNNTSIFEVEKLRVEREAVILHERSGGPGYLLPGSPKATGSDLVA